MMFPNRVTTRFLHFCIVVCWLSYSANSAANIEIAKFLEIGATATDNINLVELDTSEELVFSINPAIELKYAGNRFGVVARGEVELLRFSEAEDEIVDPRFASKLSGTLIDNLLFVDASLVVSKLAPGGNLVRLSDDSNTAGIFKATTFLDHSFGRVADFYLAHTYSTFANEETSSFETDRNLIQFSLERNPQYGGLTWGVGGFHNQDNSDQNTFQNSYLYTKLGATVTQTLLAEVTYGVERRDLDTDTIEDTENINDSTNTLEDEESEVWQVDFTWSPSEFTTLTAGYGERFFGSGPSFQLKHRVRNSRIIASYTRGVTRQTPTLDGISTLGSSTDLNPSITDTDTVTLNNGNVAAPLDEPFVDNRFRLAYKLAGRRSDFIIDAVYSEQQRLNGTSQQQSLIGTDAINSLLARMVLDRRLSNFLTLRLQYDHQRSEAATRPTLNYTENRVAVKFIYHFDGNSEFDDDEIEID